MGEADRRRQSALRTDNEAIVVRIIRAEHESVFISGAEYCRRGKVVILFESVVHAPKHFIHADAAAAIAVLIIAVIALLAPIEVLAEYEDAAIVHIDPFPEKEALFASPLWQAIPAVSEGRFAVAAPAWTFGNVVSLQVLAERMADALVEIAPE